MMSDDFRMSEEEHRQFLQERRTQKRLVQAYGRQIAEELRGQQKKVFLRLLESPSMAIPFDDLYEVWGDGSTTEKNLENRLLQLSAKLKTVEVLDESGDRVGASVSREGKTARLMIWGDFPGYCYNLYGAPKKS